MQSGEISGFVIQRDDASWYAGQPDDPAMGWLKEREHRHIFKSGREAMETLELLQASGHTVRLYALI